MATPGERHVRCKSRLRYSYTKMMHPYRRNTLRTCGGTQYSAVLVARALIASFRQSTHDSLTKLLVGRTQLPELRGDIVAHHATVVGNSGLYIEFGESPD